MCVCMMGSLDRDILYLQITGGTHLSNGSSPLINFSNAISCLYSSPYMLQSQKFSDPLVSVPDSFKYLFIFLWGEGVEVL